MSIEVELKFRVADQQRLSDSLASLGFRQTHELEQSDEYFAHPCRDFIETDEAIRIRTEGEVTRLTYKGPKLDKLTKTRREIELDLGGAKTGEQMREVLLALGFKPSGLVAKQRVEGRVDWQDESVLVALDHVQSLGQYVEFEIVVAEESQLPKAQSVLISLAEHLDLGQSDRRSYLQILDEGA